MGRALFTSPTTRSPTPPTSLESNKCLESIVAAMCSDKTQSEVFFGAFDYIKRAYKTLASDSGAS